MAESVQQDGPSADGSGPALSVVVPTRNRREKVVDLARRLLLDPVSEVVVVDDGSTDGTAEALEGIAAEDSRLVVVRGRGGGGASRARLEGARSASGDVLLLLDDDVVPAPGLAAGHRGHHADGVRRVVLGYMPTVVPSPVPPGAFATVLYAQEYEQRCREYEADPALVLTGLWLGNASMPRAALLAAYEPGRMPDFPYRHQDRILGLVLRDMGLEGRFDRDLLARHRHDRPLPLFLRDSYDNGRGREEIHRHFPTVLPAAQEHYLTGLPRPVRSLVAATRHEPVRRVVIGGLSVGIRTAGAVRARPAEMGLARLARRVEQLHGARDAARSRDGGA